MHIVHLYGIRYEVITSLYGIELHHGKKEETRGERKEMREERHKRRQSGTYP